MELGLFYIYWLTGSLPYREYFTRVLAATFFSFWKPHFWSSPSYSSTDLRCGKTWSSATKGRFWARLLDQLWPGWGLQGQISCAVKMCVSCIAWHPQPTLKNTLLSVFGEELLGQLCRHQTKKKYENGLEQMMMIIALFIALWGATFRAASIVSGLALQSSWAACWVWGDLHHHNPFYRATCSGFRLVQVRRETHPSFYTGFACVIYRKIPDFFLGLPSSFEGIFLLFCEIRICFQ